MANKTGKGGFGDNPQNRNVGGQRSAEAIRFTKAIRDALIEEGSKQTTRKGKRAGLSRFQSMIIAVWDKAESAVPWAVEYVSERTEGKVTQPLGMDKDMPFTPNSISIFVHDDGTP